MTTNATAGPLVSGRPGTPNPFTPGVTMAQPDRDAIRRVLAEADGFSFDCLEPHDYQRHVDALLALPALAVVAPPTDRALLLRVADHLTRTADQLWPGAGSVMHADAAQLRRLAVLPEPTDRAAMLSDSERQFLDFALDQAAEEMSLGDGFTDEDRAALERLRRLAVEAHGTGTGQQAASRCDGTTRVRALHQPDTNGECQHCHHSYPCPTLRALDDGTGAQQQPAAEPQPGDRVRVTYEAVWAPDDDPRMVLASNHDGDRWHNIVPDDARIEVLDGEQQAAAADGEETRDCGHSPERHGPESGCVECRCPSTTGHA